MGVVPLHPFPLPVPSSSFPPSVSVRLYLPPFRPLLSYPRDTAALLRIKQSKGRTLEEIHRQEERVESRTTNSPRSLTSSLSDQRTQQRSAARGWNDPIIWNRAPSCRYRSRPRWLRTKPAPSVMTRPPPPHPARATVHATDDFRIILGITRSACDVRAVWLEILICRALGEGSGGTAREKRWSEEGFTYYCVGIWFSRHIWKDGWCEVEWELVSWECVLRDLGFRRFKRRWDIIIYVKMVTVR